MNRFSHAVLMSVLFAVSLVSCSTIEVYQYQYDSTLDEVFVRQGADFSRYTSVMIDPISVWYPDEHAPAPENAGKVADNLAKAQVLFRETIAKALSGRYTVTDNPGRDVLRVHVEFADLRAAQEGTAVPGGLDRYEFEVKPGHITMTGELFDSRTGDKLAQIGRASCRERV